MRAGRSTSELLRQLAAALPEISPAELPGVLAELEGIRASAWLRLRLPVEVPEAADSPKSTNHERLIDAPEAARRLGTRLDWIRRHTDDLPFTVRLGRRVRFSVAGLALTDVTVKKELGHLRAALRYAKVNDRIRFHVFEKLNSDLRANLLPRETKSAGQVIEDHIFEAIVGKLLPIYRPVVRLLRLTGMRKGEVCGLRWADVRRDRIAVSDEPGNKTGERDVPLTPAMKELLPPRRLDGSALVFEAQGGGSIYHGLGQAWDEARGKAGYPTIRLHDIRHTVATELDELGDRTAMRSALGMSDATVARYAEHRRFDRSVALFDKYETRHKFGTATNRGIAE